MSRYVVREGAVRGKGRYLGDAFSPPFSWWHYQHDGSLFTKARAEKLAERYGGRLVRWVSLSERLRGVRKRLAEAEQDLPTTEQLERIRAEGYKRGRDDERAAVQRAITRLLNEEPVTFDDPLEDLADLLERGEHVKGET